MLKTFPIEFVRQVLEQTLLKEHKKNPNYFGGKNQVSILSFYEQLKSQDEVDRFVNTYRDLSNQQNRTGLILNGVLISPENPSLTNLYSCTIVPLTWSCSFRCKLEDRDQAIETLNNVIEELKGRKVDIAQLECVDENGKTYYQPFMVGTVGENDRVPKINNEDYIGPDTDASFIDYRISTFATKGITPVSNLDTVYFGLDRIRVARLEERDNYDATYSVAYPYVEDGNHVYVEIELDGTYPLDEIHNIICNLTIYGTNPDQSVTLHLEHGEIVQSSGFPRMSILVQFTLEQDITTYVTNYDSFVTEDIQVFVTKTTWYEVVDDGNYNDIIFPPEHTSMEKYKMSLGFDTIRCDEPRTLNAEEYCEITISGSATLANAGVQFGNDLIKVTMQKKKIDADTPISFSGAEVFYLEPLEMPSGNNINTQVNQLISNKFVTNSHADAISLTLQYTFIYDRSIDLLKQLFKYGRYGKQGLTVDDISPNMIFEIKEYWSSWGVVELETVQAKIVENIDVENTESDTLTLSLTMQIQGVE